MTKPHYDVLIATPGRNFIPEYIESLLETVRWLESEGKTYKFLSKYSSFVPSARELTAIDSYENDWKTSEVGAGKFTYGKIFWIDSDISWTLEAFRRLFESELEIVSGLYQTHPNGTVALALESEVGSGKPRLVNKLEFLLLDEPVEVIGVGFGFVAVKQGVFEKMPRPWFRIKGIVWDDFPEMEMNVGEDYSWCFSAIESGFKVWADPLVKVWHHKDTIYVVE